MTELIKLINKDLFNFNESKEELNEASGINSTDLTLPDSKDQETLNKIKGHPEEAEWNDLYKKYLSTNNLKFYTIAVDNFNRKTPIEGEPNKGYIKYTGNTKHETTKKVLIFGGKDIDTLKSDEVSIVAQPNEATLFNADNARTVVDAIKRNADFNLRGTSFNLERAEVNRELTADYSTGIMLAYYDSLAGDGESSKIRNALSMLRTICGSRYKPLAGNTLFNMINAILKNKDSKVRIDGSTVLTLNNLVAYDILSSKDIINPNSFIASLPYNDSLYRFSDGQIKKIVSLYYEINKFDETEIPNQQLAALGSKQIARHCLMNTGNEKEADNFVTLVKNGKLPEDVEIEKIGFQPEGELVSTWIIRTPEEIEFLKNTMFEKMERKEDERSVAEYFLQVVKENGKLDSIYDLEKVRRDEDEIMGEFTNVNVQKGWLLRIVRTSNQDETGNLTLKNLIPEMVNFKNLFNDNQFVEKSDNNLIAKTGFVSNIEVDIDKFEGGMKIKKLNITGEISTLNQEESDTEPEAAIEAEPETTETEAPEETTTTETNTSGEAFVGNKSLEDISKMSKEEFKTFAVSLTPEDKAKLKALGGKLLALK